MNDFHKFLIIAEREGASTKGPTEEESSRHGQQL